jgi:hypothetical protein
MNARSVVLVAIAVALVSRSARAEEGARPAPPPDVETHGPSSPLEPRFHWLLSLGASYRSIFALPVESYDVGLGAGFDIGRHAAFYVHVAYENGHTPAGLGTQYIQLGAGPEGVFGPLRPGVGVDLLNCFVLHRISDGGGTVGQCGVGLYASLALDLLRFDDHALFVAARFDADALLPHVGPVPYLGGQGSVGLRW